MLRTEAYDYRLLSNDPLVRDARGKIRSKAQNGRHVEHDSLPI